MKGGDKHGRKEETNEEEERRKEGRMVAQTFRIIFYGTLNGFQR